MEHRRATLKDVARESGVSPTTVSFVLNNVPGQTIPLATRDKVHAAARQLGYTPHSLARALREGSSRVVLLSIGDLRGGNSLESFIQGMADELSEHGYALIVNGAQTASANLISSLHPSAVVNGEDPGAASPDREYGGWADGMVAHTVTQLSHLVERGHTRVAFALPADSRSDRIVQHRIQDIRDVAERLSLPEPCLLGMPESAVAAAAALTEFRSQHVDVTAIAAFDDETALRVLSAMADNGLTAPADYAVIGFDAGRFGALWRPALTTVQIEAETFGRRAARTVLGLELGPWAVSPSSVIHRATT